MAIKCKGKGMWAYLNILDTKFKPCWRISVIIDKAEASKLIELGLKKQVKRIDPLVSPDKAAFGDYEIKFVRYEDKRGKMVGKNTKPTVVDSDNEPFEGILGNGSDVIVKFDLFKWKNNFGTGIGADLVGVKVINLVPYESAETKSDTDEEETTIITPSSTEEDVDDKW